MEHKIKNWVLGLLFSVLPFITEAGYDDCVNACVGKKAGKGIECDRSFIRDVSGDQFAGQLTIHPPWWKIGGEIIVIEGTLSDYSQMSTNNDKLILTAEHGSIPFFDPGHLATICYHTEVCRDKYDCEMVIFVNSRDWCRGMCK